MATGRYLFTSESVSMGHPDKLADQISDGVLDALLAQDPYSRVACETLVTTGVAIIAGEITTKAVVDYSKVVRDVIRERRLHGRSTWASVPTRVPSWSRWTSRARTSPKAWTRTRRTAKRSVPAIRD